MINKNTAIAAAFFTLVLTLGAATFSVAKMGTASVPTAAFDEPVVETLVLKQGSSGSTVRTLQQKLKNWGYYTGAVDGVYGAKTKAAVISFQKKNGLVADGIAGAKTLAAMGISTTSTASSSTGGYTSSDTNLHRQTPLWPHSTHPVTSAAPGNKQLHRSPSVPASVQHNASPYSPHASVSHVG